MNLFFLHHSVKELKDKTIKHPVVPVPELEHDITEGGEFLDDAIRMKDQPLTYTEVSITHESSEDYSAYQNIHHKTQAK